LILSLANIIFQVKDMILVVLQKVELHCKYLTVDGKNIYPTGGALPDQSTSSAATK